MLEDACQGLSITPEQLQQELEAGRDMPDLACGALASKALWLTATTLALMRYRQRMIRGLDLKAVGKGHHLLDPSCTSKKPTNRLPCGAPCQINWRGGISQKVVVWLAGIPLIAARISLTGTPV
jgi:hypothetical protein